MASAEGTVLGAVCAGGAEGQGHQPAAVLRRAAHRRGVALAHSLQQGAALDSAAVAAALPPLLLLVVNAAYATCVQISQKQANWRCQTLLVSALDHARRLASSERPGPRDAGALRGASAHMGLGDGLARCASRQAHSLSSAAASSARVLCSLSRPLRNGLHLVRLGASAQEPRPRFHRVLSAAAPSAHSS